MKVIAAAVILPAFLAASPASAQSVGVELIADDLDRPVFVTSPPGDPRLFIVEQTGAIRIVADGSVLSQPFLNLSASVSTGPEQGLLGLAFHPGYASNGRFFVNYTDASNRTHIVEYRASSDPNIAATQTAQTLLTIQRPTWRHNGGWMSFGPDGLLYVSSGDGGGTDDPHGHGQNATTLMGTIFRMNVDAGGEPEVVAWGLRNPWRASFDGNRIYLGDVGQDNWEEIDVLDLASAPVNFGWSVLEGAQCYKGRACDPSAFTAPAYSYSHQEGCSVTGGYVYHGTAVPALRGHYLFADWCSGWVRSLYGDGQVADWSPWLGGLGNVTSFGVDAFGELYIVVQNGRLIPRGGAIYRIVPR